MLDGKKEPVGISLYYVLHLKRKPNISAIHIQGKSKGHPLTGHESPEGNYTYSSTLSLTSALDGVGS